MPPSNQHLSDEAIIEKAIRNGVLDTDPEAIAAVQRVVALAVGGDDWALAVLVRMRIALRVVEEIYRERLLDRMVALALSGSESAYNYLVREGILKRLNVSQRSQLEALHAPPLPHQSSTSFTM